MLCLRALAGLAGLASDLLAAVHDALALVGLGRPQRADVGGHLAHGFLGNARDRKLGLVLNVDGHARGRLEFDGVRVAEAEGDLIALLGDAVANADQLEVLGVALVDADDHVRDQAAHETVQRAVFVVVAGALADDVAIGQLHRDLRREGALERALRAFDPHAPRRYSDLDGARHRDWQPTYSRQLILPCLAYQT